MRASVSRAAATQGARTGALWLEVGRVSVAQMKRDRVSVAAGAFAYRWFLSVFPLIIALLGIASLTTVPHHVVARLIQGVTHALPSGAAQVLVASIANAERHSGASLVTTVIAVLVALWSSTSGMVVVEEGLDMAYGLPADRSFLAKRAVAVPLLCSAVVLGGAASALTVFGLQIGDLVHHVVPVRGASFSFAWTLVRWLAALTLMNLLLSVFYYLAPNRHRIPWRWHSAGASVATLLWAMVSLGFSLYTSRFGSFGETYGAFAGVAILIFWLYLSGLAILVGAEVNAAREQLEERREDGADMRVLSQE